MEIIKTTQFLRTQKHLIKKRALSKTHIDDALSLFKTHPRHTSLQYKKMACKKEKERYSIRIPGTQYRILMNVTSSAVYLVCVCNHDEYDRRNHDC